MENKAISIIEMHDKINYQELIQTVILSIVSKPIKIIYIST